MKTTYTFTALRYVHDVTTGEFANVGVALYAPEAKYLGAICVPRYSRLTKMFLDINGDYFRSLMRFVQTRFEVMGESFRTELPLTPLPKSIMEIATQVLPPDDSSLQWSEPGGGVTDDPAEVLEQTYIRLVEKYEEKQKKARRDDEAVWHVFKVELETKKVLSHLKPKRIVAPDYDHEFDHTWKNQKWHIYEPMSFDYLDADSIMEKANRWLGRMVSLSDSPDKFKLHVLLGEPSLKKLKPAYIKAGNILNKIPGEKVLISENEAGQFSKQLADEIDAHGG